MEEEHKVYSPRKHIWVRPGMYIGSKESEACTALIVTGDTAATETSTSSDTKVGKLMKRGLNYEWRTVQTNKAFLKVFGEIFENALDRAGLDDTMTQIVVNVETTSGKILVSNDGKGIPVKQKEVDGKPVWIPELVFSHFRSGSNFDDITSSSFKRFTGGMNGYGAKLTNVLSKYFKLETIDRDTGKKFTQVCRARTPAAVPRSASLTRTPMRPGVDGPRGRHGHARHDRPGGCGC